MSEYLKDKMIEKMREYAEKPKYECVRCKTNSSIFWHKIEVNEQSGWLCDRCMLALYDWIHGGEKE